MMDATDNVTVTETPARGHPPNRCLVITPAKVSKSKPVSTDTNKFNGASEKIKISEKIFDSCKIQHMTTRKKHKCSQLTDIAKEQLLPIKPARSIFKRHDLMPRELMHGWW